MTLTLASDGTFLVNRGGANTSEDGVQIGFTVTGTNSLVLSKNTAPPGAAAVLVDVPYVEANGDAEVAGTAITETTTVYVSAADAALDLYAVLAWTSGRVVVRQPVPIALDMRQIDAAGSKFSLA